jgi:hypothetical protein
MGARRSMAVNGLMTPFMDKQQSSDNIEITAWVKQQQGVKSTAYA